MLQESLDCPSPFNQVLSHVTDDAAVTCRLEQELRAAPELCSVVQLIPTVGQSRGWGEPPWRGCGVLLVRRARFATQGEADPGRPALAPFASPRRWQQTRVKRSCERGSNACSTALPEPEPLREEEEAGGAPTWCPGSRRPGAPCQASGPGLACADGRGGGRLSAYLPPPGSSPSEVLALLHPLLRATPPCLAPALRPALGAPSRLEPLLFPDGAEQDQSGQPPPLALVQEAGDSRGGPTQLQLQLLDPPPLCCLTFRSCTPIPTTPPQPPPPFQPAQEAGCLSSIRAP